MNSNPQPAVNSFEVSPYSPAFNHGLQLGMYSPSQIGQPIVYNLTTIIFAARVERKQKDSEENRLKKRKGGRKKEENYIVKKLLVLPSLKNHPKNLKHWSATAQPSLKLIFETEPVTSLCSLATYWLRRAVVLQWAKFGSR